MPDFVLNPDFAHRDTLLFGEPLDWLDQAGLRRRAHFSHLSVEQLEQVIGESFLDGEDRDDLWLSPNELVKVARRPEFANLTCWFEGFVLSPVWELPVAINGIRLDGCVSHAVRQQFYSVFEPAETIELSSLRLRATWTAGLRVVDAAPTVAGPW